MMTEPMKMEDFEQYQARFGRDVDAWPADEKAAAQAFLSTTEGKRFQAIDSRLDVLIRTEQEAGMPVTDGDDAFLERLLDIPGQHAQLDGKPAGAGRSGLIALMQDIRAQFSPFALASQGAVLALVLAVGVFVGLQSSENDAMSVDLSSTLFASSADFYLEE